MDGVITITSPNGNKKIIKPALKKDKNIYKNDTIVISKNKSNTSNESRRAKPFILKAGLTKERTPYKSGGIVNGKY